VVLEFTKMNGAGNDFVLIDNRAQTLKLSRDQIVRLCDRHRGIGADGVMILIPSTSGKADWAWDFFNSDGSVGECAATVLVVLGGLCRNEPGWTIGFTFETGAGIISVQIKSERVTVSLTSPRELRLDQQVPISGGVQTVHSLNTGVPHAVLYVPDADKAMVEKLGHELRHHPHFAPKGTNVNFVQVLGPSQHPGAHFRTRGRGRNPGLRDRGYCIGVD